MDACCYDVDYYIHLPKTNVPMIIAIFREIFHIPILVCASAILTTSILVLHIESCSILLNEHTLLCGIMLVSFLNKEGRKGVLSDDLEIHATVQARPTTNISLKHLSFMLPLYISLLINCLVGRFSSIPFASFL
jgi:hypothetical protein